MRRTRKLLSQMIGRQRVLFVVTLLIATICPQLPNAKITSATGGYIWSNATTLNAATYDWGYATCPTTAFGCMAKTYVKNGVTYGQYDARNFYFRNCTSYVAWRVSGLGINIPTGWGSATTWDTKATAAGYAVDTTPEVGDIAQWDNVAGGFGHVAYVEEIGTGANAGKVRVAEYNWAVSGGFTNNRWTTADHYISIGGSTSAPTSFPDGTYLNAQGSWYVVAGGAPMAISSFANVPPFSSYVNTTPAVINSMPNYPVEGTLIRNYGSGGIYVIAGGAPTGVSSLNNIPYSSWINIDGWAISNQLLGYPSNGTQVRGYVSGRQFLANGGSVTEVTTSPLPSATIVDDWSIVNQLGGTL